MYLLDTNVLSELQKPQPHAGLSDFLKTIPASQLYISSVTLSELSYGIHRLPEGKKRRVLLQNLAEIRKVFKGRILLYSEDAAVQYGDLLAAQEKRGFNDDVFDTMLIAQALENGMSVITRNEKHFKDRGVSVINPFIP